jgi:hypothetical protein
MVEVADAVFAHQPGGFLGDPSAIALDPVVGVDAMVFTPGHIRLRQRSTRTG